MEFSALPAFPERSSIGESGEAQRAARFQLSPWERVGFVLLVFCAVGLLMALGFLLLFLASPTEPKPQGQPQTQTGSRSSRSATKVFCSAYSSFFSGGVSSSSESSPMERGASASS